MGGGGGGGGEDDLDGDVCLAVTHTEVAQVAEIDRCAAGTGRGGAVSLSVIRRRKREERERAGVSLAHGRD